MLSQTDKSGIRATEMKFYRLIKRCTRLDQIRNEDIAGELNMYSINDKEGRVQRETATKRAQNE